MIIYLAPVDGRKSFYNKCHVEESGGIATLYSYNTEIMSLNLNTREVEKFDAFNYSVTTRRHQRAFIAHYNITEEEMQ